jgi:hypothetical protein
MCAVCNCLRDSGLVGLIVCWGDVTVVREDPASPGPRAPCRTCSSAPLYLVGAGSVLVSFNGRERFIGEAAVPQVRVVFWVCYVASWWGEGPVS